MGEIKTYNYNFPPYDNGDIDITSQIGKIIKEVGEVNKACDNTEQVAIECMDVIVTCETLLRMLPEGYTDAAKQMVYAKIARRGKWEEDTTEQTAEQATDTDRPHPSAFVLSMKLTPSMVNIRRIDDE
ncbi:hypothetical protein Ccur_02840 [Cryptobacterium curtum DSM 15641]|uniref:Uncharacterized protein n=1 Tax=Cryptobacterium curtum (strain ATCC 700683 / DSM 15641 / CCUG 43107 / 12-3) TaxID=469378 RepID=C7MM71_CRYCD|nr:hypothetical protein [Cryptobacterium curtum]ACU94011.1 hypothetical protein Ccur_02840 [Cryptobacterium curtum DSM 15641]